MAWHGAVLDLGGPLPDRDHIVICPVSALFL